ncbi:ribokinase [Neobacillus cucumis]|uniref:Ribokinase n=1 Tax=Neobacillus cucumis TaxID=1740721 RepID=A0A2N5HVW7_9BACI|nr:ribokinase [Neobacillus cucumis]PLS09665.1 ribokinase [Neobacillus cucumis]
MRRITVIGSINMDIVTHVPRLPLPGETLKGLKTAYNPGGKGANQAIAAFLAGGSVTMIGAVGEDEIGQKLLVNFQSMGLDTSNILTKKDQSGIAFITVDLSGENQIVLSEGSNAKLFKQDLLKLSEVIKTSHTILLQNEIPWETTRYLIELAHSVGIRVVLNPAPAIAMEENILRHIDVLILNETEAETITDFKVLDEPTARKAAEKLLDSGVREVIITLGEKGSLYLDQNGEYIFTSAYCVEAVDTTAAGDTFIGVFTVTSAMNLPKQDCLRFASAAAAISVTRNGAQGSIPHREEIELFLKDNNRRNGINC